MEGPISKNLSWQMRDNLLGGNLLDNLLFYVGINDQVMSRAGQFQNYVFP